MAERPTRDEAFMRMAEVLALRSTCSRLKVGALVTDRDGLQVLGIGYNGNASGLSNHCDDADTPGRCGCIHAELNALLKAPGTIAGNVLYTTMAPCESCAKLILNTRVARVVVGAWYRSDVGLDLLVSMGIRIDYVPIQPGTAKKPAPDL